jgi:hypothetical protein
MRNFNMRGTKKNLTRKRSAETFSSVVRDGLKVPAKKEFVILKIALMVREMRLLLKDPVGILIRRSTKV